MKLLILTLLALPAISFATEIPPSAKFVYQVEHDDSKPDQFVKDIQVEESKADYELQCQSLFYKWEQTEWGYCYGNYIGDGSAKFCNNPIHHIYDGTQWYTHTTLHLYAYCAPRGFDEKVLVSLERSCEIKPEMNCLDEKVRAAFRGLNVTQRINIGRPN